MFCGKNYYYLIMDRKETGKMGENIAYKYLLNNGYLMLARNHREKFDEIDIIARHRDGTLIFCEVKTIIINNSETFYDGFMPEDNLSVAKHKKMIRATNFFLAHHYGIVREDRGWQIDLIAIVLNNDGKLSDLRHYENI